jgi:YgiT-type zinc finger domain-containing protein
MRVQLLEQAVAAGPSEKQPMCPACGTTMVPRSRAERQLTVQGDEAVHLERSYVVCPSCGTGLFPPG